MCKAASLLREREREPVFISAQNFPLFSFPRCFRSLSPNAPRYLDTWDRGVAIVIRMYSGRKTLVSLSFSVPRAKFEIRFFFYANARVLPIGVIDESTTVRRRVERYRRYRPPRRGRCVGFVSLWEVVDISLSRLQSVQG